MRSNGLSFFVEEYGYAMFPTLEYVFFGDSIAEIREIACCGRLDGGLQGSHFGMLLEPGVFPRASLLRQLSNTSQEKFSDIVEL